MSMVGDEVTIIGAGLAGCEAAMQLARRGIRVLLLEMKPQHRSEAHSSNSVAELVCSNSLRSAALGNAVGLLKEELRQAGSLIMEHALRNRVPAGGALAVDRERFSEGVSAAIAAHPNITLRSERVETLAGARQGDSTDPLVIATGPLTAGGLAEDLAEQLGSEHLAYYDAIAPIVTAESIDTTVAWRQSRYDKPSLYGDTEADYLNCPFDDAGYEAFVAALVEADKVPPRAFEKVRYFEGCLPVEVMAERGLETLAYGPLKPVGLTDPRSGRRPRAVVQLRAEDAAGSAFNLVGFQTRMTHSAQRRVFRMIPGLEQAEFLRLGAVHRNTFVNAPTLLDNTMQVRALPGLYITGQLAGVEGYVESTAAGLLCGLMLAQRLGGGPLLPPPPTTALGAILTQLARVHPKLRYQPSNITWAHFPPLENKLRKSKKRERYQRLAERALADLPAWLGNPSVAC